MLLAVGGGGLSRLGLGWTALRRTMAEPAFAGKVQDLITPPPPPPPPKKSGEALRLLTLLQRKGRLLDFLLEDIQGATNEQIGAGVRELHKESQGVLEGTPRPGAGDAAGGGRHGGGAGRASTRRRSA